MNPAIAAIVLKALDGLSARATATAENIANAGSPGYRPLKVSFEDALKDAAARGTAAVKDVPIDAKPDPELDVGRVDLELATQAQTATRYGALIDILNREMSLNSLAATGAR